MQIGLSQECCLFCLKSSLWSSDLSCLLATAILDSFSLFYLPNIPPSRDERPNSLGIGASRFFWLLPAELVWRGILGLPLLLVSILRVLIVVSKGVWYFLYQAHLCMKCSFGISDFLEEIPAAAAKSLQSCPTLCYPIDSSPPRSPVPGILQARILEWVAISLSNAWKWKVKVKSLSRVGLLAIPWTKAF